MVISDIRPSQEWLARSQKNPPGTAEILQGIRENSGLEWFAAIVTRARADSSAQPENVYRAVWCDSLKRAGLLIRDQSASEGYAVLTIAWQEYPPRFRRWARAFNKR